MPNKAGRWVTIHGRAIFIGEGQSLEEAMNTKGQVKKSSKASGGSLDAVKSLVKDSSIGIKVDDSVLEGMSDSDLRGLKSRLTKVKSGDASLTDYRYIDQRLRPKNPGKEYFGSQFYNKMHSSGVQDRYKIVPESGASSAGGAASAVAKDAKPGMKFKIPGGFEKFELLGVQDKGGYLQFEVRNEAGGKQWINMSRDEKVDVVDDSPSAGSNSSKGPGVALRAIAESPSIGIKVDDDTLSSLSDSDIKELRSRLNKVHLWKAGLSDYQYIDRKLRPKNPGKEYFGSKFYQKMHELGVKDRYHMF